MTEQTEPQTTEGAAPPLTKIVYQTNPEGIYIGETLADESPLEPGVWLIPGGCVETPPPVLAEGELAKWDWVAMTWSVIPKPAEPEPEPDPAKTIVLINTLWSRMTDPEAEAFDAQISATSVRLRRVFNALGALALSHPDYAAIRDLLITAVGGAARADEILAPEL